jgi:hypothetical protein
MTKRAKLHESLRRLVALWRQLLGLQDWAVAVKFVDSLKDADARITIGSTQREAVIEISDPIAMSPGAVSLAEHVEQTLVQELLHLYFYQAREDDDEERAINRLTRAIVGLTR